MSKDSSALRASGSSLTSCALPSTAVLQDARWDSSGERYCKDYSILLVSRLETCAARLCRSALRARRRRSRPKGPHQYSSSVTKIDPDKLSTCLQVLSEVESLPPDHP